MPSQTAPLSLARLGDEDLVARYQCGDRDAVNVLLQRYRRFARSKARIYFLVGAESDDVEQEGLIGLCKAARDYRPDRHTSFPAFAEVCATRQVISAIKGATRQKHRPLNQYVSISGGRGGEMGDRSAEDLIGALQSADPAEAALSRERVENVRQAVADALSTLEVDVLRLNVQGKSYQEIGDRLGRQVKSIDNALQRIKRKLDQHHPADRSMVPSVLAG